MIAFKVENLTQMHSSLQSFVEYLRSAGMTEDDVFFSRLVGCELITNVIRHCGNSASFSGEVEGDDIVICVSSGSRKSFRLCRELPDAMAESGRGLYIVNVVCKGDVSFEGDGIVARIKIGGCRPEDLQ